jgi:hypothetical protein
MNRGIGEAEGRGVRDTAALDGRIQEAAKCIS